MHLCAVPVCYIVSASLNPLGNVVTTGMIPKTIGSDNFHTLFNTPSIQYARWYVNTMIICVA